MWISLEMRPSDGAGAVKVDWLVVRVHVLLLSPDVHLVVVVVEDEVGVSRLGTEPIHAIFHVVAIEGSI